MLGSYLPFGCRGCLVFFSFFGMPKTGEAWDSELWRFGGLGMVEFSHENGLMGAGCSPEVGSS